VEVIGFSWVCVEEVFEWEPMSEEYYNMGRYELWGLLHALCLGFRLLTDVVKLFRLSSFSFLRLRRMGGMVDG
jgi:hypothetical protein